MMAGNEREDVEKGGKIILPPSALDLLTRLNIVYPMLFKLFNVKQGRHTHCGVLEFVADEGKCYLPHWMMQNLILDEGDLLSVESASLPVATFARFQPQSVDFLDISNPKAVLENVLRTFACLTTGDVLAIKYNDKVYELLVLEAKPQNAVSIIECDMQVDFAPPIGYVEPSVAPKKTVAPEDAEPSLADVPAEYLHGGVPTFPGLGSRVDGKKKKRRSEPATSPESTEKTGIIRRGIPDLKWAIGTIEFKRKVMKPVSDETDDKKECTFTPFEGSGQNLRRKK